MELEGIDILNSDYAIQMQIENSDDGLEYTDLSLVHDRIEKELSHYKTKSISFKDIQNLRILINTYSLHIAYFEIVDNKIYSKYIPYLSTSFRASYIEEHIGLILKKHKIPNLCFFLSTVDDAEGYANFLSKASKTRNLAPIFAFAKNKNPDHNNNYILFPDDYTLAKKETGPWAGWNHISKEVLMGNDQSPWEDKVNSLIWRGIKSDDNSGVNLYPWESKINTLMQPSKTINPGISADTPRQYLVDLSTINSNLIDAKFMGGVSKEDQIKYKMSIVMDGHTCTYPGFLWRLLSNSLTFKQETDNEQWFYDSVKPWVHYIPVTADLSDLLDKIEWVKAHDQEAKKIADRSTKFVQNNLMMSHVDYYIVKLLTSYSKLLNFKLKKKTIA